MNVFHHIRLVARQTLRHALRSGSGVVFVVLSVLIGLATCDTLLSGWELMARASTPSGHSAGATLDRQKMLEAGSETLGRMLEAVLGLTADKSNSPEEAKIQRDENQRRINFIVKEQPTLLVGFALLLLYMLPIFVSSGAFNQLSGDVQSNALRYQLPRTTRAGIYFGRFAGNALFVSTVMLLLIGTVFLYVYGLGLYPWQDLLSCSARTGCAFVLLSLPYVALCMLISACIDSALGSLVTSQAIILALPGAVLVAQIAWDPLGYLGYLLPFPLHHWFFHPDLSRYLLASLASLAYTAVYLWLGYAYFRERDL